MTNPAEWDSTVLASLRNPLAEGTFALNARCFLFITPGAKVNHFQT